MQVESTFQQLKFNYSYRISWTSAEPQLNLEDGWWWRACERCM